MTETGGSFGGGKARVRGAGGTPGGVTEFFIGCIMAAAGIYLLLSHVHVHTSSWRFFGMANGMGLSLLPLVIGIGILFWNGKSMLGWLLTLGGFGIVIVGVFSIMDFRFQDTSLFNVLLMLGLTAGGLGVIARSLKPHGPPASERGSDGV